MKLEDKCMGCNGAKERSFSQREGPPIVIKCPACQGRGSIPSAFGREVIEFIQKYFNLPSIRL